MTVKSPRFFVLEILLHLNLDGTCNPTWELILRGGETVSSTMPKARNNLGGPKSMLFKVNDQQCLLLHLKCLSDGAHTCFTGHVGENMLEEVVSWAGGVGEI